MSRACSPRAARSTASSGRAPGSSSRGSRARSRRSTTLEHPTVECIKREVGGAWWECRAHEGDGRVQVQGRGRAARGDPRDRVRARGTASTSRPGRSRRRTRRRARRGVTSRVSAPVAPGYGPRHGGSRRGQRPSRGPCRSFPRPDAGRRGAGPRPRRREGPEPPRLPPSGGRLGRGAQRRARALALARAASRRRARCCKMNHDDKGFDCPGCAWPDDQRRPAPRHLRERHQARHLGDDAQEGRRREFFAAHTVTELAGWTDFALEDAGPADRADRLRRRDATRYVPISWEDAFALVGSTLRGLASPDEASFYTSGRLGNEATFLYQLWVREFGTNNLPDCSNMCHEASGRALHGVARHRQGHVRPRRLGDTPTLIFVIGVNAASNAPRMLTALAEAYARGAQVVHVNPLVEAASGRTIVPHDFVSDGDPPRRRKTGTLNVQPRIAGDLALLRGVAKAVLRGGRRPTRRRSTAVPRRAHDRVRRLPAAVRRDAVGRSSSGSRASTRRRSARSRSLYRGRERDASSPGASA